MQRVITLDGVIYVHENARRRRVRRAPEVRPEPLIEPDYLAEAPEEEPLAEVAAVVAEPEPELVAVQEPETLIPEPEAIPEPEPARVESQVAQSGSNSTTIVRTGWKAPPPGYAVEFGTGRVVPIHSYKGRMSYR